MAQRPHLPPPRDGRDLDPGQRCRTPPFDPWNACTTGHQRPESRVQSSTGWKHHRQAKLHSQFSGGLAGAKHAAASRWPDRDVTGSDGRAENEAFLSNGVGIRERGQMSIVEAMQGRARRKRGEKGPASTSGRKVDDKEDADDHKGGESTAAEQPPQIFRGLNFYVNGSTAPLISDHKLKQLITTHGGRTSIGLSRRRVTHVIIGSPNGTGGVGGGLAGGKLQNEIASVRGKGIKFVDAAWILDSLSAGKRVPESSFRSLKIAASGQQSVHGIFNPTKPNVREPSDSSKDSKG